MERSTYVALAAGGLRMPIAADLTLHEQPDPEAVVCDGQRLGRVLEQTARRYGTPLAFPLMDLRLEKADLLALLSISRTRRSNSASRRRRRTWNASAPPSVRPSRNAIGRTSLRWAMSHARRT